MRKFLVSMEVKYELPPITYDEFKRLGLWSGASDMAYSAWLSHNKFHELQSFNTEFLATCSVVISSGEPSVRFDQLGNGTWTYYTGKLPRKLK